MATFRAIRIDKTETGQTAKLVDFDESELMDGDVTVRVEWSTVNYKDGLAVSGKAPVVRRFPMIPGIDFVGMVESSTHPEWKPGDRVILCTPEPSWVDEAERLARVGRKTLPSIDDPLAFQQTSIWESRSDFERWWFSTEVEDIRATIIDMHDIPILPSWHTLVVAE